MFSRLASRTPHRTHQGVGALLYVGVVFFFVRMCVLISCPVICMYVHTLVFSLSVSLFFASSFRPVVIMGPFAGPGQNNSSSVISSMKLNEIIRFYCEKYGGQRLPDTTTTLLEHQTFFFSLFNFYENIQFLFFSWKIRDSWTRWIL